MIAFSNRAAHLDLDGAWDWRRLAIPTIDARQWGPRLRFCAPRREIERFATEMGRELPRFLVFGSGDFHHLTAIWLRRLTRLTTVVSFDNHPDWDIRPPRWCCGGWVNRALELPQIEKVSVWGCGNFECWWPAQVTGNRRAERRGQLEIHPWADDDNARQRARRGAILRSNWRAKFTEFAATLRGADVYITIDLDCLRTEEAATNWENGRFTLDDLVWALDSLCATNAIVRGDICGAWSFPRYARWKQRFASEFDHPQLSLADPEERRRRNEAALERLLPALSDRDQNDAGADQERTDC